MLTEIQQHVYEKPQSNRVDDIADHLRGQCLLDLSDVCTESEMNDVELMQALDDLVVHCTGCSWWVDTDEAVIFGDEWVCAECVEAD